MLKETCIVFLRRSSHDFFLRRSSQDFFLRRSSQVATSILYCYSNDNTNQSQLPHFEFLLGIIPRNSSFLIFKIFIPLIPYELRKPILNANHMTKFNSIITLYISKYVLNLSCDKKNSKMNKHFIYLICFFQKFFLGS